MTISILPAIPDDSKQAVDAGTLAYRDDPVFEALYHLKTGTPEQIEQYKQWRTAGTKVRMSEPGTVFFKAVDDSTGLVIGLVGILEPFVALPPPPQRFAYSNAEVAREFDEKTAAAKAKWFDGKEGIWYLQVMYMHPDYQGRGIAKRLLQTALQIPDQAGQDVGVIGSIQGRRLYQAMGFELLEVSELETLSYPMAVMLRKARKS